MTDSELLADVSRSFASFVVQSWRPLGEGWMSRALLVNESQVLRFAKHAQASADLAKEVALLPAIAAGVSLSVPCFELIGRQSNGLGFVGYRLLEGEPLQAELLERLGSDARANVAQQVATFLDELQALPGTLAQTAGLVATDHHAEYTRDFEALQSFRARLSPEVAAYVERRFTEFLSEPSFFANEPRLIHADLSPEHLLFDSAKRRLTGIIDFGDLSLGDPDYEYLYLLEDLGLAFTQQVIRARRQPSRPDLLQKVGYYVTFDHVHSILSGLERGEPAWVGEGVVALSEEAATRILQQSRLPTAE